MVIQIQTPLIKAVLGGIVLQRTQRTYAENFKPPFITISGMLGIPEPPLQEEKGGIFRMPA